MECLANVELTFERMQAIVHELRGCLAWGGTADLSPADDALIAVERPLSLDSPGQMVASILSRRSRQVPRTRARHSARAERESARYA